MKPVAQKVAKELQKHKQRKVVDLQAMKELREQFSSLPTFDEELDVASAHLMRRYQALMMVAQMLMSAHALDKLVAKVDAAQEAYMPGGPPMSPVTDSLFMTWMLCDVTVGAMGESLASIVADLVPVLGLPRPMQLEARACAESRLGLYRVDKHQGTHATLFDLVEQKSIAVRLVEEWGAAGQLWLVRVNKNPDDMEPGLHVLTTPYVLLASEGDWQAYLGRVSPDRKLDTLLAHFKRPKTAEFWLDYVMDGYAGVEDELICLEGVPDRPESLPHSSLPEPGGQHAAQSPLVRLRETLWRRAQARGISKESDELFLAVCEDIDSLAELSTHCQHLVSAFQIYGYIDESGRTVTREFSESKEAQSLPVDMQRELRALLDGWFSVFEVRLVRLDEGLELHDTLRRKTIFVRERSATHHVSSGDVLVAQVMSYEDGIYALEGAIAHVPRLWVGPFVEEARGIRDLMTAKLKKLDWRTRAGLLIPELVDLYEDMLSDPPLPQLVNFDGEELVWCEGHYDIQDRVKATSLLNELAEPSGPNQWDISGDRSLEAQLRTEGERLIVQCNSRERFQKIRRRVEATLGGTVRWKVDTFRDGESIMREAKKNTQTRASARPPVLAPEVEEAVLEHIQGMMRSWLDEPIPMLKNKSPRQAVRSERGRAQVVELLIGQERALKGNAQIRDLDLQFMWDELGLKRPLVR